VKKAERDRRCRSTCSSSKCGAAALLHLLTRACQSRFCPDLPPHRRNNHCPDPPQDLRPATQSPPPHPTRLLPVTPAAIKHPRLRRSLARVDQGKFQLTQRLSFPQPGPKRALANLRNEPLFILKRTHPAPPWLCLLLPVTSVVAPMPPTHRCLYHLRLPLRQLLVPCLVQHLPPLPLHCCSEAPRPLPLLLLLLAAFLEDLVV